LDSDIRTKMAVVRLRRRKWGEGRKMARSGLSGRGAWFGQMAGEAHILRVSDR
jgi:hypothetical protein